MNAPSQPPQFGPDGRLIRPSTDAVEVAPSPEPGGRADFWDAGYSQSAATQSGFWQPNQPPPTPRTYPPPLDSQQFNGQHSSGQPMPPVMPPVESPLPSPAPGAPQQPPPFGQAPPGTGEFQVHAITPHQRGGTPWSPRRPKKPRKPRRSVQQWRATLSDLARNPWAKRGALLLVAAVIAVSAFVLPRIYDSSQSAQADPSAPAVGSASPSPTAQPLPAPPLTAEQEALFVQNTQDRDGVALDYIEGRNGYYFLGDPNNANLSQAVGRRTYSPDEIAQETSALRAQQQYLASRGIPLAYVVAPAKWSIYGDQMPDWTGQFPKTHIFDQLLRAAPDLPFVDVRPSLTEGRRLADTYSPYNSHWTDYGAAVAFPVLAQWIEEHAQSVGAVPVPQVTGAGVLPDYNNELAAIYGLEGENPWTTPVFATPLSPFYLTLPSGQSSPANAGFKIGIELMPAVTTNPSAPNKSRVLVMSDSTVSSMSPILSSTFGTVKYIRHNLDLPSLMPSEIQEIDDFAPDLVIYMMTERHFNLPLNDGPVWDAAMRFSTSTETQLDWPEANAEGCVGPPQLSTPMACRISAGSPVVLEINATTGAPGEIGLTIGDYSTKAHLGAGRSTTYVTLPAQAADGDVMITTATSGNSPEITAVQVRAVT